VHVKGILSLSAAFVAAIALVSSSGAGTASRGSARIDLSTRASVVHYLRAIHVDPRGVVIQRGAHNYAGPRCPGKAWNCTSTAHPVVQIASEGGKNYFGCAAANCTVVQAAQATAVANTAKCVKTSGILQSCSINQTSSSADNVAIVYMNALKTSGLTQDASQVANIVQQATGGASVHNNNRACVTQFMRVDTSTVAQRGTPVIATLNGHQTLLVKQDSRYGNNNASEAATSASGGSCDPNTAHLLGQQQIIRQVATGGGRIEQYLNTHNQGANLTLDIAQNQNGGGLGPNNTNNAVFSQDNTLTAIAKTPVGPVVQTQSTANGGLLATVNQFAHGLSNSNASQREVQCEDAHASGALTCDTATQDPPGYSLTQTQYGPVRKGLGDSVQEDNPGNTFIVNQSSTQDNDTGSNQTNVVQGDCSTSGDCTVAQETTVNGETTTNEQSGQNVDTQTTCSGSTCETTGPGTTGDLTLLPDGLSVANTDVGEFGYGGMRSSGTGSITVSGVPGPVFHAFLYWNGPTNSEDPDSNASVTFNGTPITGTNIGTASDNNWEYLNGQSYRADVTPLVSGNGTYSLSDFIKTDGESIVSDINGAALIVFYDDVNSADDRNVTLWNGNDSNTTIGPPYSAETWDETISNVPYPGSGSASLDLVVSDGQYVFDDDALVVNGTTVAPAGAIFSGDSTPANTDQSGIDGGSLWDIKSFDITSLLSEGSNDVEVTTGVNQDYLSLVVAIANVPASAPIITVPSGTQRAPTQTATPAVAPAAVGGVPGGGAVRK
jgi:hypothetical protein